MADSRMADSRMDVMAIGGYILYGARIGSKGSYGHVYKCRRVAEVPHADAFPVGAIVEAHSLKNVALNGARGKVVGLQDERVRVELPGGAKALKPMNLKLVKASSSSQEMPRLVGKFVLQGDPGGDASERRKYEDVRREASLLSSLAHTNIVTLVDLVVANGVLLFVMPHYIDGDLSQVLRRLGRNLVETEAVHAYRQPVAAIRYVHFKKVEHRDIKCQNLLVSCMTWVGQSLRLTIVVTDFGQSKMCGDIGGAASAFPRRVGTIPYMPPEMYENERRAECGYAVDCWSLGVVAYEIMTGSFPGASFVLDRGTMVPCPCQSSQPKLNDDIYTNLPPLLHDVLVGQLQLEPEKRMTARTVLDLVNERYPAPSPSSAGSTSSDGSWMNITGGSSNNSSWVDVEDEAQPSELEQCRQQIAALKRQLEGPDPEVAALKRQLEASNLALAEELQIKEGMQLERDDADLALALELDKQEHQRHAKRQRRHSPLDDIVKTFSAAPFNCARLQRQLGALLMQ